MPSPSTPSAALPVQAQKLSTATQPESTAATQNGEVGAAPDSRAGSTADPEEGAGDGGQDFFQQGKKMAKKVLAASNADSGPNGEQSSSALRNSPTRAGDGANGTFSGRKRSRSGSHIPQATSSNSSHSARPPRDLQEYLLNEYINRDHLHAAAMTDQNERLSRFQSEKQNELDYYKELRRQRQLDVGSVFGYGYKGYGNGFTDEKGGARLAYPAQRKRAGNRRAREIRVVRKDMGKQAEQVEDLVPIRLDVELDKLKLRDTFTWNLHERVITPEQFAEHLVEDFKVPPENAVPVAQQVSREIREQLHDFHPHVFLTEEALDPHLPYYAYKNDEMRVLIKLNLTIGQHTLMDQFEWDINNSLNSPEEFARQMARDLSLSGEFTTAIAHSIREQCQMFTKSLFITGHPFDGRPIEDADVRDNLLPSPIPSVFRPAQAAKDFAPALYELSEADLDRAELSLMREQRRQKRSVNRRGGPALPDLKDRQRTTRTLVVSSVLPGAAEAIETSRLFKVTRTSGRGRRAAGRGDGADESDESDSDDSAPDSPPVSSLPLQGTSRTRGMRGAASAAQAAMRANLGRSATPELASLHHHETRTSARRFGGHEMREESVTEPTSLIVKLRIPREKYRQWLQSRKTRRGGDHQQGYLSTPLMASQNNTPRRSNSAASSMPPPPSPAMQNQPQPESSSGQTPSGVPAGASGEQQRRYLPDGRLDAPHPQPTNQPPPPPPGWLNTALAELRERYPGDAFEAVMRYTPVDSNTNQPVPMDSINPGAPPPHIKFQYMPRIRCKDCPGKLYTAGPNQTVENFEVHVKNRQHRKRVEARTGRQ